MNEEKGSDRVVNNSCCHIQRMRKLEALHTYQHGSPQVKLVKECSHKDVGLNQLLGVRLLNLPNGVCEPLKLLLVTSHPDEVHLNCEGKKVVLTCPFTLFQSSTRNN